MSPKNQEKLQDHALLKAWTWSSFNTNSGHQQAVYYTFRLTVLDWNIQFF